MWALLCRRHVIINYLLQRLHRWSLRMDKWFHPTLYTGCDYISMQGLKLIHVSKRGHWRRHIPSWIVATNGYYERLLLIRRRQLERLGKKTLQLELNFHQENKFNLFFENGFAKCGPFCPGGLGVLFFCFEFCTVKMINYLLFTLIGDTISIIGCIWGLFCTSRWNRLKTLA